MQKKLEILQKTKLFKGLESAAIETLLTNLGASKKVYQRGEFIYHAGEQTINMGMVLTGAVHVIKEDFWGNRDILTEVVAGGLFAENYSFLDNVLLEVSVLTIEPTEVLFLDVRRLMSDGVIGRNSNLVLIKNLLTILAQKNLMLTRKMEYLSQRTTKDKLLSYLSAESQRQNTSAFTIPFNRQQLADYLAVDRSAMSATLCKLRDAGILEFNKNKFIFKK
ncbi:MAG: Crp/Fnr family transcriptional regulator [Acidaminococcaceae bacterium]|nr:Crp/Fnr family transcriptional regulator [Acidaminococcaceae bacterium]